MGNRTGYISSGLYPPVEKEIYDGYVVKMHVTLKNVTGTVTLYAYNEHIRLQKQPQPGEKPHGAGGQIGRIRI